MRIHLPGQDMTFDSAADLSTHQFKFAIMAAAAAGSQTARVNVSGANGRAVGIIQDKPSVANFATRVRVSGRSKLVVDGSGTGIVVGSPLKSDASGRGVVAGTDKDKVGAIACETSSAANDVIDVLVSIYDIAV